MKPLAKRSFKLVPGENWASPKEAWGFRAPRAAGSPEAIAREFLRAHADVLELRIDEKEFKRPKVIESVTAHHVIFEQRHRGKRVRRGYVTVHVGNDRRVYLMKNRAVPRALLAKAEPATLKRKAAARVALRAVRAGRGEARVVELEQLWFPRGAKILPAWRARVLREQPKKEWILYLNARTGAVLSRLDNLAEATGRARVFDPNPVIALRGHTRLVRQGKPVKEVPEQAYSRVKLVGLDGKGKLDGVRVTTKRTKKRVTSSALRFEYAADGSPFAEVMAYYHIDRALRYLESLGYKKGRAIFKSPVEVDAHATSEDQSRYSPYTRRLTFGYGGVDDAHDAETILHELGHAIQDAICPEFGQSVQAMAMGEGFGDYFAASFFASKKTARYEPTVMSWDGITWGGDPPCVRRLDEPMTFESFDHASDSSEHDNGQIWSATLWDIRKKLGREVADRIIIESHFQLDGFTTFARGARAILDADRLLYKTKHHRAALVKIFNARGIGPVS